MKPSPWQFSLRQLLIVMTGVAVVAMLVSHQWRFAVGLTTLAACILDVFRGALDALLGWWWPGRQGWHPGKPTEREIREFARRYPKLPQTTNNSAPRIDSN